MKVKNIMAQIEYEVITNLIMTKCVNLNRFFYPCFFFLDELVDLAESAELASINQNTVLADLQIKMHMVFRKMATQISKELYFVFVFMLSLNGVLASKFYDFTAFDIKTSKSVPMKNYKGKVRRLLEIFNLQLTSSPCAFT